MSSVLVSDSKINQYFFPSLAFLLSALVLMSAAFVNHFPLTHFGDTAVYIMYGFTGTHPAGTHSLFYGLWILVTSFGYTLWLTIFFQSILLTYCINECVYNFTKSDYPKSIYHSLIYIILISYSTSLLKYSGIIMPDIFTSVGFCVSSVILLGKKVTVLRKILLYGILIIVITFHTSHVLTFLLIAVSFILIYQLIFKSTLFIPFKTISIYCIIVASSFILIPIGHLVVTGQFYFSKSSQTFLIGRLAEAGILDQFLIENCKSQDYSLCPYIGSFTDTGTFLWNMETSPLYKNGDLFTAWGNTKEEYGKIVKEILTQPKYLLTFIVEGIKTTFQQFFTIYLHSDNHRMERIAAEIWVHLPSDLNDYNLSLQAKGWFFGEFDENIIERSYLTYFISAFLLAFILFLNYRLNILDIQKKLLFLLFVIFIFSNASVCGFFSAAAPRYQDRVVWLFPFMVILLIIDPLKNLISKWGRIIDHNILNGTSK